MRASHVLFVAGSSGGGEGVEKESPAGGDVPVHDRPVLGFRRPGGAHHGQGRGAAQQERHQEAQEGVGQAEEVVREVEGGGDAVT